MKYLEEKASLEPLYGILSSSLNVEILVSISRFNFMPRVNARASRLSGILNKSGKQKLSSVNSAIVDENEVKLVGNDAIFIINDFDFNIWEDFRLD